MNNMSRYEAMFQRLDAANEGAFVPFVVLGDPDYDRSLQIIKTLAAAGADGLELGFPFSDPLADGPTIQAAMTRSLESSGNTQRCFELIKAFRQTDNETPIGLLVYANLVHAFGVQAFYDACRGHQVDSVLVADVPVSESTEFCQAAMAASIAPILLCPPNIDEPTLKKVAATGRGYTYLLSRAGVTGTKVAAGVPVGHLLKKLIKHNAAPPLLGFGISQPQHVAEAISAGAKGVIVGSAIVQIIENNLNDSTAMCQKLSKYVGSMKAATARV